MADDSLPYVEVISDEEFAKARFVTGNGWKYAMEETPEEARERRRLMRAGIASISHRRPQSDNNGQH